MNCWDPPNDETIQALREGAQQQLKTTLSAYLETLIPRDETPGTVELGRLESLLKETENAEPLEKLIAPGGYPDGESPFPPRALF